MVPHGGEVGLCGFALWLCLGSSFGMSRESGVYQVGVLLQDAQEFAGRAIRGADALFPVPDGGKGES